MSPTAPPAGRPRPGKKVVERRTAAGIASPSGEQRELRARGRETMAKLLDAAVEVFASRGYHAARVDDIVRAAKTSHGTFYLYFANKEDLFRALTEHVAEELAALVESLQSISGGVRGRRALTEWIDHFAELYDHYGPVIRTWTEAETGDTALGELGEEMFGRISGALAERIAESSASGIDPDVAALALLAMAERFNYYAVSGQVVADRAELVAVLGQISHSALFGQGSGRKPRISKEH